MPLLHVEMQSNNSHQINFYSAAGPLKPCWTRGHKVNNTRRDAGAHNEI